jgi:predicted transcriptional regulator
MIRSDSNFHFEALFKKRKKKADNPFTRYFVCCKSALVEHINQGLKMSEINNADLTNAQLLEMTTDITTAYLSRNTVNVDQIPELLRSVYSTLDQFQQGVVVEKAEAQKPFTSIKKSITDDYIICLEDGKKLKMLKRHLRTTYNMTPDQYRAKWGLPSDYPMVAPNYAQRRAEFARQIGLGKKAANKNSVKKAKKAA